MNPEQTHEQDQDNELVLGLAPKAIDFLNSVGDDPLEILSLSPGFSATELEDAGMKFVLCLYPDMLRARGASEDLIRRANAVYPKVIKAYSALKNELAQRQEIYDEKGQIVLPKPKNRFDKKA